MRKLDIKETQEILSLTRDDINGELLRNYFAGSLHKEPRFNTFDKFTLPANKLYNKTAIETTIGRYLVNMFAIPEPVLKKYGYQNVVLDKKGVGALEKKIAKMILDDELSIEEYGKTYLDNGEWLTMSIAYYLNPTSGTDSWLPIPKVIKRRDELFEEYKKDIDEGNPNVINNIEKELCTLAKEETDKTGDESFEYFKAGIGDFENHYKKMSIMNGAVLNPFTNKIDVMKSNLADGVVKKEIPIFANVTVIAGKARGVDTQMGGYDKKKFNNAAQLTMLDDPGSDCGTTAYINLQVNKDNVGSIIDRYYLDTDGKLKLITDSNSDSLVGKTIKLRSPMCCKNDKICSKCAGEFYYKMGTKNVGMFCSVIGGNLMNLSMRKFHDMTVKFNEINVEDYLIDVK